MQDAARKFLFDLLDTPSPTGFEMPGQRKWAGYVRTFADAVENGVKRASKTLKNVTGAWVADHEVSVSKGKISEYKVRLKVTFVLED